MPLVPRASRHAESSGKTVRRYETAEVHLIFELYRAAREGSSSGNVALAVDVVELASMTRASRKGRLPLAGRRETRE